MIKEAIILSGVWEPGYTLPFLSSKCMVLVHEKPFLHYLIEFLQKSIEYFISVLAKHLYSLIQDSCFIDIGIPEDYEKAQKNFVQL